MARFWIGGLVMLVAAAATFLPAQDSKAHKAKRVTITSICHWEENYYSWGRGNPWRIWGKVKPRHRGKRVVLQKSKYGRNWRPWRTTRTNRRGEYEFRGTSLRRQWWMNYRVVLRARGHQRTVSRRIYVDTSPATYCR